MDMVNGLVLYYLHLKCVGVLKRLLNWFMPSSKVSKIPKKVRIKKIDRKLELFEKAILSEFNGRLLLPPSPTIRAPFCSSIAMVSAIPT